ncbi:MAG TPA: substrate-binding domain-containing protein [Naasia sp.]|jgi:DNA-binding LacI/PurR family transcriptional regulator
MPTVLDVARAAGVSRQTVSNVLNAPGLVREATRERVLTEISRLGYQPHASARRLRTRRSSTLGVRLHEPEDGISGALLDQFLHSLTASADRRGYRVMLFAAADPGDEVAHIRRLSDGADVDAFVLTSTEHGDSRVRWLLDNDVPFITFGRPWGGEDLGLHPWVDVDGRAGTREATLHLLDGGRRRVGFLGWPSPSGTGDDRRLGWEQAVAERGAPGGAGMTGESEDHIGEAEEVTARWLDRDPGLDGLVCASDSLALGASFAAGRAGRALEVIGFDNTPVARALGLSSVEQRTDLVAAAILDLLLDGGGVRTAPEEGWETRLIAPELVLRSGRPGD